MAVFDRFRRRSTPDDKAINVQIDNQGSRLEGTAAVNRLIDVMTNLNGTPSFPFNPLPRDPRDRVQFGPGHPLASQALDPPYRNGRPVPRYTEYAPNENLNLVPTPLVPFQTLRDASETIDLIRRCIEKRKKEIAARDWSFTIAPWAVNLEAQKNPGKPKQDIKAQLSKEYSADIAKANAFWRFPGKNQDYDWNAWVFAALEEYLVLDAWCVYPHKTYGGDLFSLDLIDGTTIKPLRSPRGGRPAAPFPAFQQILYGLPRGEMSTTFRLLDDGKTQIVENPYLADQLYYIRRCSRVKSLYGYSAVEQAMISARLYLKRQGWMLSEYDDGTMPMTWIESQSMTGDMEMDVHMRRVWEDSLNDEMSGNTQERHRLKQLPPGFKAVETSSVDERYKPDYDLFLVKLLAMHFDIPISELGFSEAKGLGSTGFHEAQSDTYERAATLPDTRWFSEQVARISHEQLGINPAVVHRFLGLDDEDEAAQDQVWENRTKSARATLNEDRDRINLPRYTFPEADMPMIMTTRGVVFLDGASKLAPAGTQINPPEFAPAKQGQTEPTPPNSAAPTGSTQSRPGNSSSGAKKVGNSANSAKKAGKPAKTTQKAVFGPEKAAEFVLWTKFAEKGRNRPFRFEHLTPEDLPDLAGDPRVVWSD